jgi:hypothetical protein
MKNLRFYFCHPVSGHARFSPVVCNKGKCKMIDFDTADSDLLELPVDQLEKGKWHINVDWEFEGKYFSLQNDFEVNDLMA